MTASSIPAAGGGGYARYLESKTVAPERGDYYPTPDGEMTQAPGRWLADPETLARLGVRAGEPVGAERGELGELGAYELPLSSVHYGLRQGDHIAFIAQHRPPGQPRVENGTRGEITGIGRDRTVTLALDGSGRKLQLAGEDVESLRLAYAQHVYRQQGATVDRAVVLTGGWQTSKETAYVQATRARRGTDWHVARDQLGEEGHDLQRITRLAQRMTNSRIHTPSIAYPESADLAWTPRATRYAFTASSRA